MNTVREICDDCAKKYEIKTGGKIGHTYRSYCWKYKFVDSFVLTDDIKVKVREIDGKSVTRSATQNDTIGNND